MDEYVLCGSGYDRLLAAGPDKQLLITDYVVG